MNVEAASLLQYKLIEESHLNTLIQLSGIWYIIYKYMFTIFTYTLIHYHVRYTLI